MDRLQSISLSLSQYQSKSLSQLHSRSRSQSHLVAVAVTDMRQDDEGDFGEQSYTTLKIWEHFGGHFANKIYFFSPEMDIIIYKCEKIKDFKGENKSSDNLLMNYHFSHDWFRLYDVRIFVSQSLIEMINYICSLGCLNKFPFTTYGNF